MTRYLCSTVVLIICSSSLAQPPATPKKPETDTYHGVAVTDDYRWLEDGNNKEVQAWSDAENSYTRQLLRTMSESTQLRQQLAKILSAKTTSHRGVVARPGTFFALRRQPPKQQPFLVVMQQLDRPNEAQTLLDPNLLDPEGHTTIDWFVPSPDGNLIAVSLSKGGSESGDVHVIEVGSGKETDSIIQRVQGGTAGGSLAWEADGKGFYYTHYPRGTERPSADLDFYQQLYYHRLGTPVESDRYEIGKDFPRVAEIHVEVNASTGTVLASVQNGDSGVFSHFLRSRDGAWKRLAGFNDGLVQGAFGSNGELYFVSRQEAPRGKMIRLPGTNATLKDAVVVVPESSETIVTDFYGPPGQTTVLPTAHRLYITYQRGGPSLIRCFDLNGKPLEAPKQPEIGAVHGLNRLQCDDLLFAVGSFTEPATYQLYSADTNTTVKLPLSSPPVVDLSDITVVREFARSNDGTKVPVNILIPKNAKRDGSNPCLVTGYGGFNISVEPGFHPAWRVLFDHGFVIAVANLRGGGEFGEAWHSAGNLTSKQNVFDDFAAVLKHMIDRGYTNSAKLAIEGGSNGGLLMGATLTQHPDLMKCVIAHVGIYDMLRVELSSNGAFNIPEYGTVKDEKQFQALHAYSPYHHVHDGTKYPATLFLTGANDPRVDTMQSRKMTARLQAASPKSTILLRTTAAGGHGLGTALSEQIEETTDVYSFLFTQLGLTRKE
jgi:prolyl oligopeptidase